MHPIMTLESRPVDCFFSERRKSHSLFLLTLCSQADGKFYLTDRNSSNGTMVYLQDPFPLPYNQTLKLRMGRTTLALQVHLMSRGFSH